VFDEFVKRGGRGTAFLAFDKFGSLRFEAE